MDSKHLSLNQRNERLIQSLSKSRQPVSDSAQNPQDVRRRRRLCKLSSTEESDCQDQIEPPSFDFDFDSDTEKSPPRIRDILNDLTSRLDSLSIQKKKNLSEPTNVEEKRTVFDENKGTAKSEFSFELGLNSVSDSEGKPAKLENSTFVSLSSDDEEPVLIDGNDSVGGEKSTYSAGIVEGETFSLRGVPGDTGIDSDEGSLTFSGTGLEYVLPGRIAKTLFQHQQEGLRWLWSLHCMRTGGILGDDMGLGKTMQIAAFLAGLFHSSLVKRALIVAPKTLLAHWIKELTIVGLSDKIREYFAPSLKTRQYELNYILQDKGILLTTYDIVRNNSKALKGASYFDEDEIEDGMVWDYVILDEGHIIKNPSTQRAKSLLDIPSNHRIVISGTPVQNNLKELWALFHFCCPSLLGDKKEFKARYEEAILRGNDKKASTRERSIGSNVAKELRERIKPYFLRRLKSEVSFKSETTGSEALSQKHEMIVWLKLTNCQRKLYEAFLKSELVLSSFDGSPLAALTILKKICDHPLLLTKKGAEGVLEGMDSMLDQSELGRAEEMVYRIAEMTSLEDSQHELENVSCKITFISSLLDNLVPEGHNVLIFSQTRKMLNLIQENIERVGYKYLRIDGTTKASDRQKLVNDFQEGRAGPIFLLTSQVGGLGLTLTNADRVIVADPAWNPSTDNQSVDRAYRIGQKKDVVVYRLMTCGTIEEKIYKMQVFKGGLFKTATEHKEQTRYFSQKDLRELLSLPAQGFDVSLTQKQLQEEHDSQHNMDDSLRNHIKFLESQGIAGVSHHSLLFSKTAPVTEVEEEENTWRPNKSVPVGSSSSQAAVENNIDGTAFALNPKDRNWQKNASPSTSNVQTEDEVEKRIERLQLTLANKALVSNLPDKGAKIQKHIFELNLELDKIRKGKNQEKEVIDLDDITEKLGKI
ncbi:protein CHROMATIN REMODELING 24 [Aristolochia californica]|uniref:protein CHROMATIN REMODELING 24 n=1 Tax=Aristolochia californica TaxID=171875 RepID=UPI0035E15E59